MHIFEYKHKAGKSTSTVQPLVQWQMLCLSPLVTQLLNVRIWPLWSHMRLSVEHRDHPLLHPPPLLLHWGPRRILTLAVATRNEQHHKDSVIPHTTDWQKPQLTGTSRSSAKVSQRKEPSALWTIPGKRNKQHHKTDLVFYISGYCKPESAQWKKTWMRGRLKKVRMPFFACLGKWIWHGCIMSLSRVPLQRQLHKC